MPDRRQPEICASCGQVIAPPTTGEPEVAAMDEIAATLFTLAADVAQDRVELGAPAELVIAVESATGLELADAVTVAKPVVRAMHAQRAVDLRLMGVS